MTIVVMGVVVFAYFWWAKKRHDRYVDEMNAQPVRRPSTVRVVPPVRLRDWDKESWG